MVIDDLEAVGMGNWGRCIFGSFVLEGMYVSLSALVYIA